MKTALAIMLLAYLAAPTVAVACSVSQFELAEKGELPRYTFVLFQNPNLPDKDVPKAVVEALAKKLGKPLNDATIPILQKLAKERVQKQNAAVLATLKKLEKEWKARANIDFEAVDISTKRGAKVAKYWQVKEFPVTFVIAPTGWSLGTFKGPIDEKEAAALLTSPGKAALQDALAKHKAAFLVLGNKKMKGFDAELKAANKAVKTVKDAFNITTTVVTVDPTTKAEAKLLHNLGLEEAPKEAQVFVTYGKGRAVLQEVEAEDTEERLAFTIKLLSTADQCSLGQEIAGEPLLLGK